MLQSIVHKSNILSSLRHFSVKRDLCHPNPYKKVNLCTPLEAIKLIRSDSRVYIHTAANTPQILLRHLVSSSKERHLANVNIIHMMTFEDALYNQPEYKGVFTNSNLFISDNTRPYVQSGTADYIPCMLHLIPSLFEQDIIHINTAIISVSPPDSHGICTLGASCESMPTILKYCDHIIAEINPYVPRTFGDVNIHINNIDRAVCVNNPLPIYNASDEPDVISLTIGKIIAENFIQNGSVLQIGIGSIPNAVYTYLDQFQDISIYTEMFSDLLLPLLSKGIITNSKSINPGKVTASFAMGSDKLYDYIHKNPLFLFQEQSVTNDPINIMKHDHMVSINTCIEIDLTGQIVSDSIGVKPYSGFGGQVDFLYGALRSPHGAPIIAFPSTTKKGKSKIVGLLTPGAGVVTTRALARYIVTEYGCVDLFGKDLRERAKLLISIAHPNHRDQLTKIAREQLLLQI
ncbi:hypothetical protein WA158_001310 [Blastocystis sp. Blastoise]